jgi:hypothetical protein
MPPRYFPEVFNAGTVRAAKAIIMTDEGPGADSETRWAVETPYVLELISHAFSLRPNLLMLDYGCGIGRLAKSMIEASGCSVIGVDIHEGDGRRLRRLQALPGGVTRPVRHSGRTHHRVPRLSSPGSRTASTWPGYCVPRSMSKPRVSRTDHGRPTWPTWARSG